MMALILQHMEQFWMNYVSVEIVLSFLVLILLYTYVIRSDALYDFIGKILVKLELKIKGHYDHVPADGESIVSAHRTRASWEMKRDNVAVFAIQGRRPHMEDRFNVVAELEHTNTSIYGIFDGHGGEFAADYVEKTLFKIIMVRLLKSALAGEEPDHPTLLTEAILSVDEQLLEVERETGEISGTTLLVALVRDNKLYVANVGDSRAVMCSRDGSALPLSFDHKPQQVRERRRIKKAGGFISFNGVWRVAGVLATSRALGDYPLKERNFVIAEPDVLVFDLDEYCPRFMIIATDGLWDAFSNEEAVEYVRERLHEPHYGAKSIVLQAYYRGSLDNITVMVVDFTNRRVGRASTSELVGEASSIATNEASPLATSEASLLATSETSPLATSKVGEVSSVATSKALSIAMSEVEVRTGKDEDKSKASITTSGENCSISSEGVAAFSGNIPSTNRVLNNSVDRDNVNSSGEKVDSNSAASSTGVSSVEIISPGVRARRNMTRTGKNVSLPSCCVVEAVTCEPQEPAHSLASVSRVMIPSSTVVSSTVNEIQVLRGSNSDDESINQMSDNTQFYARPLQTSTWVDNDENDHIVSIARNNDMLANRMEDVSIMTNIMSEQQQLVQEDLGSRSKCRENADQLNDNEISEVLDVPGMNVTGQFGQSPSGQSSISPVAFDNSEVGQAIISDTGFSIGQEVRGQVDSSQVMGGWDGQASPGQTTVGQSTLGHDDVGQVTSDEQTTSIVTVKFSTGSRSLDSQ